ncbi:MAG TPA: hypothetical protein VGF49_00415, partial [Candidatus Solibacter sp.]
MTNRLPLLAALCAAVAAGHPMGNFSVNHYARFEPSPRGLGIRYVMDLAEIPTFELFQQWGPGADPKKKALDQAREWAAHLTITVAGKPVKARVERAAIVLAEGAGNMQVAHITADLFVDAAGGAVTFEDRNYEGRSGWKEIVPPGKPDRSAELTAYPSDPMLAPPQEVKASFLMKAVPHVEITPPPITVAPPPPP